MHRLIFGFSFFLRSNINMFKISAETYEKMVFIQ